MSNLNGIIEFDSKKGIIPHTKAEILEDLKNITVQSYGNDFVIQEGTSWFSFIDILSEKLASVGATSKRIFDSISPNNATGVTLDNICALVGITRKPMEVSKVEIQITSSEFPSYIIPVNTQIIDSNGNVWICRDGATLVNGVASTYFYAYVSKDALYDVIIGSNNGSSSNDPISYWNVRTIEISNNVKFRNDEESIKGFPIENDAQLRYRYNLALFGTSVGTTEGLRSRILEVEGVSYVFITENITTTPIDDNDVPIHSIWVIVDGSSTWDGIGDSSTDENDIKIANIIKNYKSLGSGTSFGLTTSYDSITGKGKIPVIIQEKTDVEYLVYFTRAVPKKCYIKVELSYDNISQKYVIDERVKEYILNYVNNLGISNDVLFSGVASTINEVINDSKVDGYSFDLYSLNIGEDTNPTTRKMNVEVYEYATITEDDISFI